MNKIIKVTLPLVAVSLIGATIISNMPVEDKSLSMPEAKIEKVKTLQPVETVETEEPEVVVEQVAQEATIPPEPVYPQAGSLFVEVGTRLRETGKIQELNSLRFSENSVYTALTKGQVANPTAVTTDNINEKIDICTEQVLSEMKLKAEAGLPYDYRSFTCAL